MASVIASAMSFLLPFATDADAPQSAGGFSGMLVPLVLIGVVMYFMVVVSGRQQKKQEKERQDMLASLKKNDQVETGGGIMGKIFDLTDETVVLVVDDRKDVRVTFNKAMVKRIVGKKDA